MTRLLKEGSSLLCILLLSIQVIAQVATPEICNNGIDDDGDLLIDCYDPDCSGDSSCSSGWINVTDSCNPPPTNFTWSVQEEWRTDTSLYDVFSTQTPAIGDIDNDGVVEIIAYDHNDLNGGLNGPGDTLFIFNGTNGTIEGYCSMAPSGTNPPTLQTSNIVIGNLDSDPFAEIVVLLDDTRLVRFEHTGGPPTWISSPLSIHLGLPITAILNIADLNGDGMAEIYQGTHVWNGQTGAFIATGGINSPSVAIGAPLNVGSLIPYATSVAADVLPDTFCPDCAGVEIVCGFQVFSVNLGTGTITPVVTSSPPAGFNMPVDGFTAIADYDHDGDLDGIISSDKSSPGEIFVYAWDLQTPTVLGNSPTFIGSIFWTIGQTTVADFDGDSKVEIAVVSDHEMVVLDDFQNNMSLLWSRANTDESGFTGSTAFDFDGNGRKEIVYRDEDSLYIYDGGSGNVLFSTFCSGGTVMEKPLVADVDGDGQAEILCACAEVDRLLVPVQNLFDARLHGYIAAYGSAGDPWAPARDLWNQSSYHITNINDDLSLPIQQQQHHLIGNGALNGFNLQASYYDTLGNVVFGPCVSLNSSPIVVNDTLLIPKNSPFFPIPVLDNDLGDSLTVTLIFGPDHGSALVANDTIFYQPDSAFLGADSIQYAACNSQGCDTGWVMITVFFQDTVPPIANCQDLTLYLDQVGGVTLTAGDINNASTDDCGIANMSTNQTTFNCFDIGIDSVVLTVTDSSGNSANCVAQVTIIDSIPPAIVCPQDTVFSCIIDSFLADPATTIFFDNCPGTYPSFLTQTNLGGQGCVNDPLVIIREFIATDPAGNMDTCTQQISVIDFLGPNITCPSDTTISCDSPTDPAFIGAAFGYDNCGLSLDPVNNTVHPSGIPCGTMYQYDIANETGNILTDTCPLIQGCPAGLTWGTAEYLNTDSEIFLYANLSSPWVITQVDHKLGQSADFTLSGGIPIVDATWSTQTYSGSNLSDALTLPMDSLSDSCQIIASRITVGVFDFVNGIVSGTERTLWVYSASWQTSISPGISPFALGYCNQTCTQDTSPIVTFNDTFIAGFCINPEVIFRDWTATDVCGNTSTCQQVIALIDSTPPVVNCPANIVVPNDLGVCGANVSFNVSATENCNSIPSIISSQTSGSFFPVGTAPIFVTATDACGNSDTCSFTVTVVDAEDPIALCNDITVTLDPNGQAQIIASDIDAGSSDNCAIASVILDGNVGSFDCNSVLVNSVVLIVTDFLGNSDSCTANVTVQDTVPPVAFCNDITIALDANGQAVITASDIDAGSTDNCNVASVTLDGNVGNYDCDSVGVSTVTLIVTDVFGNSDSCTTNVTVQDTVPPVALCNDITIVLDANGQAQITAADIDAGSTDSCNVASVTLDGNVGNYDCDSVGVSTVTLIVTDVFGNSDSCTANVTIEDTIAPVALCNDITVSLDANGQAVITVSDIDAGSTDNCNVASVTLDGNVGNYDCGSVGVNLVTLIVTDINGNSDSCTANVTVQDTVPPVAFCNDITVALDANGQAVIVASDIDAGSIDNCNLASVNLDGNVGNYDCDSVGVSTVTLIVTDVFGNSDSCTANVTVQDTVPPVALCNNITVSLDASGQAQITASDIDAGSTDNCNLASVTLDGNVGNYDCDSVGVSTVTLIVSDVYGNSDSCTANVTIADTIAPVALCNDITVTLDANGQAQITAADIDAGSTDNCNLASITLDGNVGTYDCDSIGVSTITLIVTDVNGNSDSCTANVTVQDTVPPIALCNDITVALDANGQAVITASDIDAGSTDNCNVASVTLDGNVGNYDCDSVGVNIVTLIATDINGNSDSCTANVTVQDTVPPIALCNGITVTLDANGQTQITASDIDAGSADNCNLASITLDGNVGNYDCDSVGVSTVTLIVTDVYGNNDSCTANVAVQDTVPPIALCNDITVTLDANGQAQITAADIDAGSTDNCNLASVTLDGNVGNYDCDSVGVSIVTLIVTDVNGNSDSCTANVTVQDTVPPIALCNDITVALDANGQAVITASDIDAGSTDNCNLASVTLDGNIGNYDCDSVGISTVTLIVIDVYGNSDSCTANVTVRDTVPSVALCNDITVSLDANGQVQITASDIDAGSTDNCNVASVTLDGNVGNYDCDSVGVNTVTLIVTDINGSSDSCSANVTVQDTVPPIALCNDITVSLNANGQAQITASDIDAGSTDNCNVASVTLDGNVGDYDCDSVGVSTVTLIVIDVYGNSDSCTANVTVQDTVPPVALCNDITVSLDANGHVQITASDIDAGSTDNCNVASVTLDGNVGNYDCDSVGVNTVTLIVTDSNGYSDSCSANVAVQDTVPPVALCTDITVTLDTNGQAQITAADIDAGSTDNCNLASVTLDGHVGDYDCDSVGVSTVTLIVTDVFGNSDSCTANVTVQDTVPPVAFCNDITVSLDANGQVQITASDIDAGSVDNCNVASVTLDGNVGDYDCDSVGVSTVTLIVSDINGNSDSCTANVTVQDTVSPVALCTDITVALDANGQAVIVASDIDAGSTDNCNMASVILDGSLGNYDCDSVGVSTVTLIVTDINGNSDSCTANVTVQDTVPPVALCTDITVALDANGQAVIVASDIDAGSTDNCNVASVTLDGNIRDYDCDSVGVNTVTLIVTDINGNSDSCTANVTVQDTVPPVALCTDITVALDANGQAVITASDIDAGSTDNCNVASVTLDGNVGNYDCDSVGVSTVTLIVTDVYGNSDSCTANVTIEDTIAPVALCNDITVSLDANGQAQITASDIDAGSTDNCNVASVTLDGNIGNYDCDSVGVSTVTLIVTDVYGNSDSCTANVTIEDTIAPVALCNDITVSLDANGQAQITASDIDAGSSDNCNLASVTLDGNVGNYDCDSVGVSTVTLIVTDVNGNSDSCTANVTIEDTIAPVALCNDITVTLDANGQAQITASDIDAGSTDNCNVASVTLDGNVGNYDCDSVGVSTVTLIVTDVYGNSDSCTANVTIEDTIAPVALCNDITVSLDANGQAQITASDIDAGSSDNCNLASVTLDGNVGNYDCDSVGVSTVTLIVTDVYGNSDSCTANVTIEDTIAPVALCNDINVALDANGQAQITASDIDAGSTDNCNVTSVTLDGNVGNYDCDSVGVSTVTLIVTDVYGNSDSCTANVTIEDTIAPVALCNDITVSLDANGQAQITASDIDAGSTDNCNLASITLDGNVGTYDCDSVGVNIVTLIATDINGNSDSCTAYVTVQDTVQPIALCNDITVTLDANGQAVITASDIDAGSTDNCNVASVTLDGNAGTYGCDSVGVSTVMLIVTDAYGNSDSCTATVTIEDTIAPVALCNDITVTLDANGQAQVTASDIDAGSSDNCNLASITLDSNIINYDCDSVGVNTVTLIVTDTNGNVDSCTAQVTVEDTIPLIAICQNITVQLGSSGNAMITAQGIDNGSSGGCGIDTLIASMTHFTCADVGINPVTLTVIDVNGDSASCIAQVTVEDTIPPSAICQNLTVYLDAAGAGAISSQGIDNGSNDNCGIDSLGGCTTNFNCNMVGVNSSVLTVVDVNGNVDTCVAQITVEDTLPPNAICQNLTVQLDSAGNTTISAQDLNNFSNDNCTLDTLIASTTQFTCADVGINSVTLTVVDVNGNSSDCISQVTVEDSVGPNAICQNITLQLDSTGNASISAQDINNGSGDNCGIDTLIVSNPNFTCADVGINLVSLTVIDVGGDSSTCIAQVTVEDTIPPIAICQDLTVYLDASGAGSTTSQDVNNGSSDNCGIDSLSGCSITYNCNLTGINSATLTVTDVNGNVSTCTAQVTVLDTISPVAICQNITIQLDTAAMASIQPQDINNGSNDNCLVDSLSASMTSFTCADVGPNQVVLTAIDGSGNSGTCIALVTVEDTVPLMAVCQDLTVQLDSSGMATITAEDIDNGSGTGCGYDTLIASVTNFSCADVGINQVILIVVDVDSNISTCVAQVTVEDTLPPNAICQNLTVQLDSSGTALISAQDINNGSGDNCGIDTLIVSRTTFACADVGINSVSLTVIDVNGNISTCLSQIAIEDTLPPDAFCQNLTVHLDSSGNTSIAAQDINNNSDDNCGIDTLFASVTNFACADVGINSVILTVTDGIGNTDTCIALVTVGDTIPPNANCQNLTIQLDSSGNAMISGHDINNGSGDNCGIDTLIVSQSQFTCSDVGTSTVTLTVVDGSGDSSSCLAQVTVEDTLPPNAICQDLSVYLDASGAASTTSQDVDNGSSDNCGVASLSGCNITFNCNLLGPNSATLSVTDVNGNVSTCNTQITVIDTIRPIALCIDDTVYLNSMGTATISPNTVDGGSSDNCIIDSSWVDPNTFTTVDLGLNTVILTVQDIAGNIDSCQGTVLVLDTIGVMVDIGFDVGIIAYPIPTSGILQIEALQPDILIERVTVYDFRGRQVYDIKVEMKSSLQIDLNTVADGYYWLGIENSLGFKWEKIQVLKE